MFAKFVQNKLGLDYEFCIWMIVWDELLPGMYILSFVVGILKAYQTNAACSYIILVTENGVDHIVCF